MLAANNVRAAVATKTGGPPPRMVAVKDVRSSIANVASLCAAVMIPIMFQEPALAAPSYQRNSYTSQAAMDRVVDMEEREIPEIVLRIAEENQTNRNAISSILSIIDQIEDEISVIQEGGDNAPASADAIEARLQMIKDMF